MCNKYDNDNYSVIYEREILESLNKILEGYSELERVIGDELYQLELSKRFLKNTGNNVFKSSVASSISLLASCGVLDSDPSVVQSVVAVVTGSVVGFALFQKANRREFLANSLDTDKIFDDREVIIANFYNRLNSFKDSVSRYVDNSNITFDDFVENDFIKNIFDNNNKYIEDRKSFCEYDCDFDYEKVSSFFNTCFELENGVNEFLIKSKERDLNVNVVVAKR